MPDSTHNNLMPRKALIALAALIGFSLLVVVAARLAGYNASQMPDSPVVASKDLRFSDAADGSLTVIDADGGGTVGSLAPGNEGFVRGVLRALSRERRLAKVGEETPYRLSRLADGRLTLRDLGTQRLIELNSFGPVNEGAFARFLGGAQAVVPGPAGPATTGKTGDTH